MVSIVFDPVVIIVAVIITDHIMDDRITNFPLKLANYLETHSREPKIVSICKSTCLFH